MDSFSVSNIRLSGQRVWNFAPPLFSVSFLRGHGLNRCRIWKIWQCPGTLFQMECAGTKKQLTIIRLGRRTIQTVVASRSVFSRAVVDIGTSGIV